MIKAILKLGLIGIVIPAKMIVASEPVNPELVQRILSGDESAIADAGRSGNPSYIPTLRQMISRPTRAQAAAAEAVVKLRNAPATSNSLPNDVIIREIVNDNDIDAIQQAGRSQIRGYIPYLEQLQRHPKEFPVLTALRRLGDVRELQRTWCSSLESDGPFKELEEIGGWYGVQAAEHLLLPEAQKRWRREHAKWGQSDVPPPPSPAFWALVALSSIAPSSPDEIRFSQTGSSASRFSAMISHTWDAEKHYNELKPYIAQWQKWIGSHEDELKRLNPTGEGVDLSQHACKDHTYGK